MGKGLEQEVILQAVVVTDSFNNRFKPLTMGKPRCLLPLCNIPLLSYCLEFLASNGVDQIILVSGSYSDQIQRFVNTKDYRNIQVFSSQHHRCLGDVLRDLDAKQVLVGDFVLVTGDLVAQFNLQKVVEEHRQRREKDKNAIMTMVLKEAAINHPSRSRGMESLFLIDSTTNECLSYEAFGPTSTKRKVSISKGILKVHPMLTLHNDLIDSQIYICSLDVPALFTENFDYQDMHNDFLTGIIESEILGKTIFCHLLRDGYAATCSTQYMYHAISTDVMNRWAYPLVPENPILTADNIAHLRHNNYRGNAKLDRSCKIDRVVIGSDTRIGAKSILRNCVIGKNCTISDNVVIENSYVFDNSVIHNDCHIEYSIISHDVILKDHVILSRGCIIGENAVIGPDIKLEEHTLVAVVKSENEGSPVVDPLLGQESYGSIYVGDIDEEDEEEIKMLRHTLLGAQISEQEAQESEDEKEAEYESDSVEWEYEVKQTLNRALDEGHDVDIAALELNTLKMALNITFENLLEIVIPSLMERLEPSNSISDAKKYINQWGPLIVKFTHSEHERRQILQLLADWCVQNPNYHRLYIHVVKFFYELDILENDDILEWHENSEQQVIKELLQPFCDWLMESDDESDE